LVQNLSFQINTLNIFVVAFLEHLQSYPSLPSHLIINLGDLYKFKHTFNAEIRFRFYGLAFLDPSSTAARTLAIDAAKWLIGDDETGVVKGRMKFCRPVFRGVWRVDKDLAVRSWEKAKNNFHPIARKLIEKVNKVGLNHT
jgi:leukotriene-A4 hydrolase